MWMTRRESVPIDFAAARDEGLENLDAIIANYNNNLSLGHNDLNDYLSQNISYSIDDSMRNGMELYFELAVKHRLIKENRPLIYC